MGTVKKEQDENKEEILPRGITFAKVIKDDCDDEEPRIAPKSKKKSLSLLYRLSAIKQSIKWFEIAFFFTFLYMTNGRLLYS
jgi:hypothetical protein